MDSRCPIGKKRFYPGKIYSLKLIKTGIPIKHKHNKEQIEEQYYKKVSKCYGADELTERIVLYGLNGTYYYGGFQLLRYGSQWKVLSLDSFITGISSFRNIRKTTPENFDLLIYNDN